MMINIYNYTLFDLILLKNFEIVRCSYKITKMAAAVLFPSLEFPLEFPQMTEDHKKVEIHKNSSFISNNSINLFKKP